MHEHLVRIPPCFFLCNFVLLHNMLFKLHRQPAFIGILCLTGSAPLLFWYLHHIVDFEVHKYTQSISQSSNSYNKQENNTKTLLLAERSPLPMQVSRYGPTCVYVRAAYSPCLYLSVYLSDRQATDWLTHRFTPYS